jgi:hypothetical protein
LEKRGKELGVIKNELKTLALSTKEKKSRFK